MSDWTKNVAFPKIVRKFKHNDYTVIYDTYPVILAVHNLTGIPVELEYIESRDMWSCDYNAYFSMVDTYLPVEGFGSLLSWLDDGKYMLSGSSFPSKVIGAVKREMKKEQDYRSWSLRWSWDYNRKNPEVSCECD